ncbi:hypothetical protein DPX16_5079 [Anabarilius grahami]|uniref:Uncharacterized protein n=1 Tax=Anabarilius grahami TaxID=495550 RepID=A0A3N0XJ24_ANAGA|nr:hypothetical protein DPX16_5079 [Anabarilius grahami]
MSDKGDNCKDERYDRGSDEVKTVKRTGTVGVAVMALRGIWRATVNSWNGQDFSWRDRLHDQDLALAVSTVKCIKSLNPLRADLGSVFLYPGCSDRTELILKQTSETLDIHMDPNQQGEVCILTRERSMPVRLHHSQPRREPLMTIHSQLPSLGLLNPCV